MRKTSETEIDHIDPRWSEGRDYQLICGLNCSRNMREENWRKNRSKSNRFLPWRWCKDEIGVVPEEPGDLALFLVGSDLERDIPGNWVLMEFLSKEWFEATQYTDGGTKALSAFYQNSSHQSWAASQSNKNLTPEEFSEKYRKAYENQPEDARLRCRVNGGKAMGEKHKKEGTGIFSVPKDKQDEMRMMNNLVLYRCTKTGKISTGPALAKYQKNRGIHKSNRERLPDHQQIKLKEKGLL